MHAGSEFGLAWLRLVDQRLDDAFLTSVSALIWNLEIYRQKFKPGRLPVFLYIKLRIELYAEIVLCLIAMLMRWMY